MGKLAMLLVLNLHKSPLGLATKNSLPTHSSLPVAANNGKRNELLDWGEENNRQQQSKQTKHRRQLDRFSLVVFLTKRNQIKYLETVAIKV